MKLGKSLSLIKDGAVRTVLDGMISIISAGYHTQHTTDDTHATITATGSVSERKRTVAMGAWTAISFLASNFTATGTTWTVTQAEQITLKYMLIGTTLFVTFYINASTVGGATANLFMTLSGLNAGSTVTAYGTCSYNDNGTYGTGVILCPPGTTSPQLKLMKNIGGSVNWANSAALTIAGQIAVEVTGTI